MDEVEPAMNQRSSAMTARRKTRLVVRSGSTGIGRDVGSDEGREREKRRAGGAKSERVPVPVLYGGLSLGCKKDREFARRRGYLSGRCSPFARILRIRSRYWCSSCSWTVLCSLEDVSLVVSVIVAIFKRCCSASKRFLKVN